MQNLQERDRLEERSAVQSSESADVPRLYPSGVSLTHLGTLKSQTEAQSGWDRLDQGLHPHRRTTTDTGRAILQLHPDQRVTILHAKVAQKSYGNEKRFFCPPPCVYISGSGWRVKQDHLKAAGFGDACYRLCGYMGLDSSCLPQADAYKLAFEEQCDRRMFACAKSLYISDTDKRKHFRLVLSLLLESGQEVGSFHSNMIKVISKPSQKRQSMKNADLCISSGSRVALFNRLRSQTVSTRYLAVEKGEFVASARQWTAFNITLVEEPNADQADFMMCEGFICYGCVVQLVCTQTGVTLPPLVIRKVSKQHAILDVDEPVSQLHKCAFQFRDDRQMYLCLSNDRIIKYQASPSERDQPIREVLNDGSCWTIIGTEVVDYSFSQSPACIQNPVSPVPSITGLEVNGGGHVAMLELNGENFSPHLKVWFGNVEAETMFKSPKSMLCVVPDVSMFSGEWRCLRHPVTVPLSLLRLDGLMYHSTYSFTYTPEHHPAPPSSRAVPDGGQDSDALIDSIHQEFTRVNFHLFMQS